MENDTYNAELLNALKSVTASNEATTQSVNELREYIVLKDKEELQEKETLKKQAEEEAQLNAELDAQAKKEAESAEAEETATANEQAQTYTELLTSIDEGIQLNNQLLAVQGLYIGIVIGLLLAKIFIDRMIR